MTPGEIKGYQKYLSDCSDADLFLAILNLGQGIEKFGRMANQTEQNALEEATLKTSWEKANLAKAEFVIRLGVKWKATEPQDLSFKAHDDATSQGCMMCGNDWKSLNAQGYCSSCWSIHES